MNTTTPLFILVALFCSLDCYTQRTALSGTIIDDATSPLEGTVIQLYHPKDSIPIAYGITDKNGIFKLEAPSERKYILEISHVGFETLRLRTFLPKAPIHIDYLILKEAVTHLKEVVVTQQRTPMTIKNDTIEYNAEAFTVAPNSDVEALLKKLPGIEVAADGKVKSNGEAVSQILIDGKKFFGNDSKKALKGLPADAIKKVQVLNKLSEVSEFTGVDDGKTLKTINLTLANSAKNSYFGNVGIGTTAKGRYQGEANLNSFSATTQKNMISNGSGTGLNGTGIYAFIRPTGTTGVSQNNTFGLNLNHDTVGYHIFLCGC